VTGAAYDWDTIDPMRRYVLTGAPGAGKTTLIRCLETLGYSVVDEVATDVIAQEQAKGIPAPWEDPAFIDALVRLQRQRQIQASSALSPLQFFDRCPIDVYALSVYLGHPVSPLLLEEIKRIQTDRIYERVVFFIENLGFVQPSEARRISFEESLRFEKIHEDSYREWGYACLKIPPQPVPERASTLLAHVQRLGVDTRGDSYGRLD
jgi:predicted ATPase